MKAGIHIIFWAVSFYILLINHSSSSEIQKIDIIYVSVFLIAPVFCVYVNFYLLIPRYFQNGKYLLYTATLILLIFISVGIHYFSFNVLVDFLFNNYYLISYVDNWQIIRTLIIFIGITTLAHLSRSWFELYESRVKLQEVEKEKALYQLESLRAQINPHFLFNSLNSLYSLALKQSPITPDTILKLSDVLRYVIYESNTENVELTKELEFISNYIELQKLRTHMAGVVSYKIDGVAANKKIVPLIFIVFIENAFKHGLKGDVANQYIRIVFNIYDDTVEFRSENNTGQGSHISGNDHIGLGLENVRKRLELVYKDRYQLDIESGSGNYSVYLKIKL